MVLHARSDTANEIEILVLRHQLAVLQRRTPRPQIRWSDRAVIAALARLLPAHRRSWTTPHTRPGRPPIPASLRAAEQADQRSHRGSGAADPRARCGDLGWRRSEPMPRGPPSGGADAGSFVHDFPSSGL